MARRHERQPPRGSQEVWAQELLAWGCPVPRLPLALAHPMHTPCMRLAEAGCALQVRWRGGMNATILAAAKAKSRCHEIRAQELLDGDYHLDYDQDAFGEAGDPCEDAEVAKEAAAPFRKDAGGAKVAGGPASTQAAGLCSLSASTAGLKGWGALQEHCKRKPQVQGLDRRICFMQVHALHLS